MGATKIKILTLFFIFLFLQRMGVAMALKVYIHEHIYKEAGVKLTDKANKKLKHKTLLCPSNRVYEECHTSFECPLWTGPEPRIVYIRVDRCEVPSMQLIGAVLKKTALRGPPSMA